MSLAIVLKEFPSESRDIKYSGIIALTFWLIGDIASSVNVPYEEVVQLTFQSCSLSLLLVIFLKFIRQRKPIIFRYPYYLVYMPLLIPLTQFIVMDARVIGEMIFMMLQAISIVVFTLLSIGYSKELENRIIPTIGILLLLWGFSFYWILKEYYIVFEWAWGLTNMAGMIGCIYSFSDLIGINENLKNV